MSTMKAAYLARRGSGSDLLYGDLPRPNVGAGEVLVRVHAATVMPSELHWGATWQTAAGEDRSFPIILGHEFSGVVAQSGAGVADLAIGDEVYGMNDWDRNGAQAEYVVTRPAQIAAAPTTVDHATAAATPISALTAWQALVEHGQLHAGQRVLIHGGAGSVGSYAIQVARTLGAYIYTTVAAANMEFATSLGADEPIDYKTTRFEDVAGDLDLVLDTVGGETQARSWGLIKPGGALISLLAPPPAAVAAAHGVRGLFFVVVATHEQLAQIARLIDGGKLLTVIAAEYPLAEARTAFNFASKGQRQGKTVLLVDGPN